MATAMKSGSDNYPPYDVIQLPDGSLRIMVAVAGFARDELSVTVEGDQLVVTGRRSILDTDKRDDLGSGIGGNETEVQYLHKGISTRQFKRRFLLGNGMEVEAADLAKGLLRIDLRQRVIEPDAVEIKIRIDR